MSTRVGLRELRQDASAIVRRAEEGEEIVVTVSGRPSVRLVPVRPNRTWRTWNDIEDLFNTPSTNLDDVRDAFDDTLRDPWDPR